MEITSETIKSAMAKTLALNYPEVTLYKNKVSQGMKKPCFFITQLETENTEIRKNVFKRVYLMSVRFHKDNALRIDLDSVGFDLLSIFNTLELDGESVCYGKNLKYEIVDNVLQFFVTYTLNIIKKVENTKVDNLDIKEGVK